jgi:hypothetical protein
MNEQSGARRNRLGRPGFRRAGVLPAAVAGLALLVAACGGSAAGSAASSGTGLTPGLRQQAIAAARKYSACMRSHGIANFPDPVSTGQGISIPPMHGVNPQSQQFQSAAKACRSLLPRITAAG